MTPMFFMTPGGGMVGRGGYVKAWKLVKTLPPETEVKGWTWYPVKAGEILNDLRRNLQHRIGVSCGTKSVRGKGNRAAKRMWRVRCEAAARAGCRECGTPLDPRRVNPNAPSLLLCESCRKDRL